MAGLAAAGILVGATAGASVGAMTGARPASAGPIGICFITPGAVGRVATPASHKGQLWSYTTIHSCNPIPLAIIRDSVSINRKGASGGWLGLGGASLECDACNSLHVDRYVACPHGAYAYRNQATGYILEFGDNGGGSASAAPSSVVTDITC